MLNHKKGVMRPWLWILVAIMLVITQATFVWKNDTINHAMISLFPIWREHYESILDPVCNDGYSLGRINEKLSSLAPKNDTQTQLGRVLWTEGNCEEAITLWEEASLAGYFGAQYELFRLGKYETFPPEVSRKLSDHSYWVGVLFQRDGDISNADKWYHRAFYLFPHHRFVQVLTKLNRDDPNTFNPYVLWHVMAETLPETNPEYWWGMGELYLLEGSLENAATAFTQGANQSTDPYEAFGYWMRAGYAWQQLGNWQKSREAYEIAQQKKPEFIWSYLSIGHLYRIQGKYNEALKWYLKAQQKDPDSVEIYFYLGEINFLMGNYSIAQEKFKFVLSVDPNHQVSMYYLARIAYTTDRWDEAENWLIKAIQNEANPKASTDWLFLLGDWRLEKGDCVGAKDSYLQNSDSAIDQDRLSEKLAKVEEICSPK